MGLGCILSILLLSKHIWDVTWPFRKSTSVMNGIPEIPSNAHEGMGGMIKRWMLLSGKHSLQGGRQNPQGQWSDMAK